MRPAGGVDARDAGIVVHSRIRSMSQTERVLADLRLNEWTCAEHWYRNAIPNARNRVGELRGRGFSIESQPCPDQHGPTYHRYRIVYDPERRPQQLRMGVA